MWTQNGSMFNIFMIYFSTWCPISQTLCNDHFEDEALEEAKVLEVLKDDDAENLFHISTI